MKTQYRITGRTRKDVKRHVVDSDVHWSSLEDVKKILAEIEKQNEWEMKNKTRKAITSGMISAGVEYCSDYDLLELRIESREVSPWSVSM